MVEETKKPKSMKVEVGVVGDLIDMIVDIQDEVLDKRDINLEQLFFMTKNDGQARGILNAIKFPVKMARPAVQPSEDGEEEAKFIQQNLLGVPSEGGMVTPLKVIIARMALAVRDGYKIFEKVWRIMKGRVYLEKLAYRGTDCTKFTIDNHGNIDGAHQETTFKGKMIDVKFPLEKLVYYIYNSEENPFAGESGFYPVFYHYDKKHKLYAIAHLAYQLNALPVRLGKHPKNISAEDLTRFRNALKALGTSIAMTFPDVCTVEAFEGRKGLAEFLPMIQHHDTMMATSFLSQFMSLGHEGGGGSFALSQDQSNLFLMSLMSLLAEIAEVFNVQVIPQLIDWNFGTKKYPRLIFTPFSDTIRSAIMDTFKNLLSARFPQISPEFAISLEEQIAEELGLKIDYKEVKERMETERAELMKAEALASKGEKGKKKLGKEKEETDEELLSEFLGYGKQLNKLMRARYF